MSTKFVKANAIIVSLLLLLYAGGVAINLVLGIFAVNFSLPTALLLSVTFCVSAIMTLIGGIMKVKNKQGKMTLVWAILSLPIGILWVILGVISAVFSLSYSTIIAMINNLLGAHMVGLIMRIYSLVICVLYLIVAFFALILFVLSVLTSKQKLLQSRFELVKPVTVVLMIVPLAFSYVRSFVISFISSTVVEIQLVMNVFNVISYVVSGLSILFALVSAVAILILGLTAKNLPVAQPEQPTEEFDLDSFTPPAGVSADDIWS